MGHYIHIERYDGDELEFVADSSLQDTQQYFTDELNEILEEENIAFHFVHGQFQRRGYAQTQKNIQRVGSVLGHPNLGRVRDYYNQARKDFDKHPEPDLEHCVLLCMQALEACLEILTGKPASNDFLGVSSKLQGNGPKQIPPPIVTAMTKLMHIEEAGREWHMPLWKAIVWRSTTRNLS